MTHLIIASHDGWKEISSTSDRLRNQYPENTEQRWFRAMNEPQECFE